MIIDCISDLHGHYPKLEGGDLLIVAGDWVASDRTIQYVEFFQWMSSQHYKKIVFISGNHDNQAASQFEWGNNIDYLLDWGTEFEGLKIWGSPWTRSFPHMNPACKAFTLDTESQLAAKFALIPDDVDILVTHSPPIGIMDEVADYPSGKIEHCGSEALYQRHIPAP